jgi:hypothetical protein
VFFGNPFIPPPVLIVRQVKDHMRLHLAGAGRRAILIKTRVQRYGDVAGLLIIQAADGVFLIKLQREPSFSTWMPMPFAIPLPAFSFSKAPMVAVVLVAGYRRTRC